MFGTLHWNPHSKEAEFIERPHGSSNLEKNPACDRCRARKVKCRNPDNEGCTRCKRLGKTCTFSPGRHRQRGEHSGQKQHSSSVSVSSSSKADKETVKEPASAPPGTADNDSERGQQSLLDDIPTSFDLSFLADFDHETSDRDEDTSFALFSTIFPSTHEHPEPRPQPESQPELEPRMSMSISTTLLSPPLSSEDEMQIQHYLPPQSQDPSLFDICFTTPPSTAFPPGAGGCQCLSAVIFAVEEFEASCTAGHRAELDSITAYQKEVIRRCRSQLKCSACMARRETLVLLVFMLEKIVAACGRIVALYRVRDAQMQLHLPTPSSSSLLVGGDGNGDGNGEIDLDLAACGAATAMSTDWRELLLGDYEISSALEWEHLVRVLIFLQLRAVMELLADVKSMGGEVLGETLSASLAQAEVRLGELEKDVLIL
ncbi:hypothetical protein CNMCM5793_002400 [Aspergillus hiratsukae]|uniref:Zn(2)-C6 fungal-type domain-containing protein n=1 Tax=Aspergillus hiratsukae TaxID=1194566 RepID=A0A8H6UHJ0_9EURO|nr:hypothetical protein CNMCM5793_002400 [Aspergillus hiratsukae]KAF7162081.1 hypothetical protein CNMCM6106_009118 [Aspergillus hiratsukae]